MVGILLAEKKRSQNPHYVKRYSALALQPCGSVSLVSFSKRLLVASSLVAIGPFITWPNKTLYISALLSKTVKPNMPIFRCKVLFKVGLVYG